MIKIFSTLLLGLSISSNALAVSSQQPKAPLVEESSQEILHKSGFLIKNDELTNNLPNYLQDWKKYVAEKNIKFSCPQQYSIGNCVFLNKAILLEQDDNIKLIISGHSFVNGFLEQPNIVSSDNKNIWSKKILLNNNVAKQIKKNNINYLELNKGDFVIEYYLNKNHFDNIGFISFNNSPLIFENNIKSINFIKEDNVIKKYSEIDNVQQKLENEKEKNLVNGEVLDLNVYRKFKTSIPNLLTTQIKITYSGKDIKKSLGKVLPEGFVFNQANSNLNIEYNKGEFFVNLKNGEHLINIESFSFKNIEKINIKGLIDSVNSEIWSIEQQNNVRQINVFSDSPIDPNQGNVPSQWRIFPSYLVKNNFVFKNERQGVEETNKVNLNINRTSYYGFSDDLLTNVDYINVNNTGSQVLYQKNNQIKIETFQVNSNPQSLLKIDDKTGVLIPQGQFVAKSQNNINGTEFSPNIYEGDNYFSNWEVLLAPRHRAITVYSSDNNLKTTNTWTDKWNLYVMFSLFIITLIYFKLFGKKIALLAFTGIVMFNTQFFAWPLWTSMLVILGFLKLFPNKFESKVFKHVFNIGLIFLALTIFYAFNYSVSEIQAIINPSVELIANENSLSIINYVNTFMFVVFVYILLIKLIDLKDNQSIMIVKLFYACIYFIIFSFAISIVNGLIANPNYSNFNNEQFNHSSQNNQVVDNSVISKNNVIEKMDAQSVNSISLNSSSLPKKEKIQEQIYTKKVQVGSGEPTVNRFVNNKFQINNNSFSDSSNINMIIAPVWLVNIFGLIQIVFLVFSVILFSFGLLLLSNDKKWFNKIPKCISENKYVNYFIIQELEKGLKK